MKKGMSCFLATVLLFVFMLSSFALERAVPHSGSLKDLSLPFDVWRGAGDTQVRVALTGVLYEKTKEEITVGRFKLLSLTSGEVIDSTLYTLTEQDGAPLIRLKESYLRTLSDGWYRLHAEFETVIVSLDLYVVTKQVNIEGFCVTARYFGDGTAQIVFGSPKEHRLYPYLFESLCFQGKPVDPAYYSVKARFGKTELTLSEEYLQNFATGKYDFTIAYADVRGISLRLSVLRDQPLGDMDGNNDINAADARLALRCAVDLEKYDEGSPQFLAGDVNGDNRITAADARMILRIAVGLDPIKMEG